MKILLTEQDLRDGIDRLATEVMARFEGRPLTIVGVLTGSVVLLADLIRQLDMALRVGVIQARSYHGATTERGDLLINADLLPDIEGRDVLLVDDIFDTGPYARRSHCQDAGLAGQISAISRAAPQRRPPAGGTSTQLCWFSHSQRIRRGIRVGLRRHLSKSTVSCRAGIRGHCESPFLKRWVCGSWFICGFLASFDV